MSNLDKDIAMAAALGMSYGRYKMEHPGKPVVKPKVVYVEVEKPPDAVCAICGKHFYRNRGNKKYCGGACNEEANRRRTAAKYRQRRPEMLPRICPHCGMEFKPIHGQQKYCCHKCQYTAENQRKRERRLQEAKS